MYDTLITNGKLFINNKWVLKNLYVQNGKIAFISKTVFPALITIDAKGNEVLPGVIDPHVHFELDLGKSKSIDDFFYGSVAASYGGVTSIIDFLEPASNASELEIAFNKRMALAKKSQIDFRLHATIKKPTGSLEEFVKKMKSLGLNTLKLFTTYSDSGRRTDDASIIELLKLSKKYHFLLLAHIENDAMITLNDQFTYRDLPISRPSISETSEALKLAGFVEKYGGHLYMVHLSSGATLKALCEQYPKLINKQFFVESGPQYFTFTNDILKTEKGYLFSFAPPLRSKEEREILFSLSERIDTIGSDHCAFNIADKIKKTLKETMLGIGGVEHSFSIMRRHLGDAVINKMTSRVATLMGLDNKGKLEVGFDADLFIFKNDSAEVISSNHGKADYSVYSGLPSSGKVISTMVRGKWVMQDGQFKGNFGQWIKGNDLL